MGKSSGEFSTSTGRLTSEYAIAIKIASSDLYDKNKSILRPERTRLTNKETLLFLSKMIFREYVKMENKNFKGQIEIKIRRYLPIYKNMIENDGENQQSYEDFLNGISKDPSFDPNWIYLEVRYTLVAQRRTKMTEVDK